MCCPNGARLLSVIEHGAERARRAAGCGSTSCVILASQLIIQASLITCILVHTFHTEELRGSVEVQAVGGALVEAKKKPHVQHPGPLAPV